MTRLLLKDELLDAQLLRAVGCAAYGGADIGECLRTARLIDEGDLGSWYDAWRTSADEAFALGERAAAAGDAETARLAFLRACTYHRTAGVMLMGVPLDPRLTAAYADQAEAFRRAGALMARPPEPLEIPLDGVALPGYFIRSGDDEAPRATVILVGGYDGTAEELYFANGAAALARGYNVLAFDGPGQGAALVQRGLTQRPDWENVIAPVIDHAATRADVDATRLAVIGLSLGAYLAPRAASGEHRPAACVADCGSYDLYASALQRMPGPLAKGFAAGRPRARAIVGRVLKLMMGKPTAGWSLRRGLLVHGVDEPLAMIDALRDFTLAGRAGQITCPTWVCNAEGDDISASAPHLVRALTCEKAFVTFTAAEGADDHCEQGARMLYHARSFGWLDDHLQPRADRPRAPAERPAAAGGSGS